MLRFEWNALRAGDNVLVHDPTAADMTLVNGVVAMIEAGVARKGANGVGIRLAAGAEPSRILWPSHLAVHHDPHDPTEPCWRCQDLADHPATDPPTSQRRYWADRSSRICARRSEDEFNRTQLLSRAS